MATSLFKAAKSLVKLGATLSLLFCASFASAGIILTWDSTSVSSNSPPTGASATATLTFTDDGGQVRIDFLITNTTGDVIFGDGATSSKLTGVAFDLVTPNTGVSNFVGGTYLTTLIDPVNNNQAAPFGDIDIAVADNDNYNGGNANGALQQGVSDTASLILNGTGLSAIDLESAFRAGFTDGTLDYYARFQQVDGGNNNDASDKLNGGTCCDGPDIDPPRPAPVPGTLVLLGLGLTGLGWVRRKKA